MSSRLRAQHVYVDYNFCAMCYCIVMWWFARNRCVALCEMLESDSHTNTHITNSLPPMMKSSSFHFRCVKHLISIKPTWEFRFAWLRITKHISTYPMLCCVLPTVVWRAIAHKCSIFAHTGLCAQPKVITKIIMIMKPWFIRREWYILFTFNFK